MKFSHLHVHSHYSLLDGLPKIDQLLDHAQELGMDSVGLTDHGALYGAVEFYQKAKARGIKPIIGSEIYLALESRNLRRPKIDDKNYHLVLLIKNEKGYKNLVKLITKAFLEGFYYKPRVDEELLKEYSEGLIALSGCLQGKIPRLILANKIEEAEKAALFYQEIFGKDNFYLELQHHPNLPGQKKANKVLITLSKKLNIPLVATNDCHYLKSEDAHAQDILMLINTNSHSDDPERLTMKSDDFSMRSPEKMKEDFKDEPEAIENTQKISELCNFHFQLGKIKLPKFETENGKAPDEYLADICSEGVKKRYGEHPKKEVLDRLNYELGVISQMGFAPYFLIVQDFVNWAKEKRIIVGPGRGSVAGSLVAYSLNITSVDPLKYNLLFERFLNPGRLEGVLPDIDLDFTDRRRDEVINYVAEKYGRDKVAQIITFGTMASKAVVRDVGRALGLPYSYCDKVAKMIPFGLTLDECLSKVAEFRNLYLEDPQAQKLIDFAKKLEGCARHASTHACGVVISDKPLDEICPLQHPTQNEKAIVTQYEMHSIENLGLLKMDFLGLKNLTIIEDTLSRVYVVQGKKILLEDIPLDDKKTFQLFREGNSIAVFQFESEGMKRYLKQLKPNDIEDIIAMVALYRPGPMQFISDYIAGKYKKKKITYLHPKLKPILENTYSIPVYQEQIMKITQELAGFTLSEADVLRKAMGKKIKSLMSSQKEKFIEGCQKNEIQKEIAKKIWDWIEPFASYSFNKSHAACYAMIAYQTAYLKSHFPVEFMASLLTSEKSDVERIGFLIGESKRMGIEVLPPDINESLENFTVVPEQKKIRFGLTAIKNVGWNIVEVIVQERKTNGPYQSITDFLMRMPPRVLNKKSMESLIKSGVFDKFEERNRLLFNLEKLLDWSRENQRTSAAGQKGLFEGIKGIKFNNNFQLLSTPAVSKNEKLNWEKELLGLFVSAHPLEDFRKILEKKTLSIVNISENLINKRVRIGGLISVIKKVITKAGSPMLFVKLEDLTDKIEVIAFPSIIGKNPSVFQENKIVLISGRVDNRDGTPKIIAEDIEEIIES